MTIGLDATVLTLALLAWPPQPAAPATTRVQVVDAHTDAPIAGAHILCDAVQVATTAVDGVAVYPPCAGRLEVRATGFDTAVLDTSDEAGAAAMGDTAPERVALTATRQPEPPPYAETVSVDGRRPPTDAGVPAQFVVTAADMQALRGALLDDPLRAMQALPGVATTDELRADLSVRGMPFRQTGIVIDEIKSPLLMHTVRGVEQTGSVALLNGDMLADGSLSSGSYPQRFGNSAGAELVVRTRDGRADRVRGRLMTSAIATTASADGPLGSDRLTWIVAARRSYASWIVQRIDPGISGTFDFQDAHGKVRAQLGARQLLTVSWLAGTSTYDEHGRRSSPFALDIGRNRTQLVSAQWQATPTASLLVAHRLSYVSARFRNTNPDGRVLDEGRERELLSRTSLTWTGARVTLDASGVVEGFRARGEAVRFGGGASGQSFPFSGRTGRTGGHVHVETRPMAPVRVSAGARIDRVEGIGTAASPWAQVAVALSPRLGLQAAHGWHRQAPDLLQRFGPNAGTGLAMERARHTDVGLAWQSGHWSAALTAYDRRERGGLDTPGYDARLTPLGTLLPGDPRAPWTNALDGEAQGVEVLVRRSAVRWQGWVAYARGRVRQTGPLDAGTFPGAFDQAHVFTATSTRRLGERWDGTATLRLASNWPYDAYIEARGDRLFLSRDRHAVRLPTYARVDLRARHIVPIGTRRLVVFAEAINLLNRRNLRQVEGSYNSRTFEVFGIAEAQLPVIPSLGLAFEF